MTPYLLLLLWQLCCLFVCIHQISIYILWNKSDFILSAFYVFIILDRCRHYIVGAVYAGLYRVLIYSLIPTYFIHALFLSHIRSLSHSRSLARIHHRKLTRSVARILTRSLVHTNSSKHTFTQACTYAHSLVSYRFAQSANMLIPNISFHLEKNMCPNRQSNSVCWQQSLMFYMCTTSTLLFQWSLIVLDNVCGVVHWPWLVASNDLGKFHRLGQRNNSRTS